MRRILLSDSFNDIVKKCVLPPSPDPVLGREHGTKASAATNYGTPDDIMGRQLEDAEAALKQSGKARTTAEDLEAIR
jgi:hypothetical protein